MEQLVTIEIINLLDGRGGIKVHGNITVVSDQLNTGKAEFDLPEMETLRWAYDKITDVSIYSYFNVEQKNSR